MLAYQENIKSFLHYLNCNISFFLIHRLCFKQLHGPQSANSLVLFNVLYFNRKPKQIIQILALKKTFYISIYLYATIFNNSSQSRN
jgi:hypothetical protein